MQVELSAPPATVDRPALRRVAGSVLVGTTIEWYDFQIYGASAAVVFAPLFFSGVEPWLATILSFATFAVGFVARPLGGIVMGHFGDRIGRKKMLVVALLLMGAATFAVGLLPTSQQIGMWAPVLLVVLRLIQGFGVGGEWGGAVLTAVEYAPKNRRGFYGSMPQVGVPAGLLLATGVMFGTRAVTGDQFLVWGWRIPFLLSIVLVALGLYIRVALAETPSFTRVKQTGAEVEVPLADAFRTYPRQIVLAAGSMISTGAYFYILNTYSLTYADQFDLLSGNLMLVAVMVSAAVAVIFIPVFGQISERYGRRRILMVGIGGMGVWIFAAFAAIDTGNFALTTGALAVGALMLSISYGPQATFIAELFDARVRYSASSISFQIGVLLGGAIAPMVAATLVAKTGTSFTVALYIAVLSAISLASVYFVRESDLRRGSTDMFIDDDGVYRPVAQ
ncbi:MHS family MFS transporter [Nocardia farcinica]|uniref:Putative proline/betaine transporter n=4 Tax=Nocardia TaxID=1817 RepID=Q5YX37_NOCFA|nr:MULTISPECIES: MFS transporter [Nocardia]AXK85060.1 MFS transporter [Nocardia farcinica]MBA4855466.1 MHS family MFS transporter [Nocardia farcinica]MBC9818195.1 MHS family MFS transporter [Nocardia farcinica]MBF6184551.1 MHS family MFS transporter [Nocardia farcinica]MBF6249844.1 MHS family MFS transporter [Nocardia farcinica]